MPDRSIGFAMEGMEIMRSPPGVEPSLHGQELDMLPSEKLQLVFVYRGHVQ
jgi:hypothetical protein